MGMIRCTNTDSALHATSWTFSQPAPVSCSLRKMPAPVIDYGECLRDSPKFRQQLNMNEVSLDELEVRMEKLVKVCNVMIEGGKSYISQQAQFLAGLWEMSSYFASDQETETTATLNKLIHTMQELTKFQNILIDQASRSITKNLTTFLREDIKQMKETKGYFNKISNDLDSALTKNAAVSKSRPSDLEDASNLLTATRSCFRYTGMDYVKKMEKEKKLEKQEEDKEAAMNSYKENLDKDEKDVDTCVEEAEESSLLESVLRASTLSTSAAPDWSDPKLSPVPSRIMKVLNAEVCLFGGSLGKHHVASVELDSDQESTDGEGDTTWSPPQDRVDMLTPDMLLYRAARAHNLPVMLQALALGAETEWQCGQVGELRRTAMHQSVLSGSVMATEFLILNNAKTVAVDEDGNTALHLASQMGNTGQVCLLLKHRADHHRVNNEGKEPLDIAVANSDADIVTLLRLAA